MLERFKKWFKRKPKVTIEEEIKSVLMEMRLIADSNDPHYDVLLGRLCKLKEAESSQKDRRRLSPDTIVVAVAALVQTVMIIKHEELNTITTKAMNFVLRGRT